MVSQVSMDLGSRNLGIFMRIFFVLCFYPSTFSLGMLKKFICSDFVLLQRISHKIVFTAMH